MKHAKLLDCTLRDGAYLVDKKFGEPTIYGIAEGLVKANIEFIELGFFQDNGFGEGKTVFKNSEEAKKFIPSEKNKSRFTVLADCSRYSVENLDICDGTSIDAIRECFFKHEKERAIDNCKEIKKKGYLLFVQPVDVLGYSDKELLELIDMVNEIDPYCFSIVDTFGSMYQDDLIRIFELVNHNLVKTCKIGFHSHNNMQMSNALSQSFLEMSYGKREVVIDGTLAGMGRGAGNTPLELIAQYMNEKLGYSYDMDEILDLIDGYLDNIKTRCEWGYTIPYFIAGCFSAHVNNISYLIQKKSISSKGIRRVLNDIGEEQRKRYDYALLENEYLKNVAVDVEDEEAIRNLEHELTGRNIVLIAPGKTAKENILSVKKCIEKNNAIVIAINFFLDGIDADFFYASNIKRFTFWKNTKEFMTTKRILTSNVVAKTEDEDTSIISFSRLIRGGWNNLDNAMVILLRLLDLFELQSIYIAGFDGYTVDEDNYVQEYMESSEVKDNPDNINKEISDMLEYYMKTRVRKTPIMFITDSRFKNIVESLQ